MKSEVKRKKVILFFDERAKTITMVRANTWFAESWLNYRLSVGFFDLSCAKWKKRYSVTVDGAGGVS